MSAWEPLEQHVSQMKAPKELRRRLMRFFRWANKTPAQLLEMQRVARSAKDDKEQFAVLDLVEEYVRSKKGARSTKETDYTCIRSFFAHHRRPLPSDPNFSRNLRGDRPRVTGKITMEVLRTILESLRNDSRRRSMVLTQFGGFMGTKELILVNKTYGHMIGEKLKAGEQGPIEIEMTWQRKGNPEPYHTYLSTMACQELKKYFESVSYTHLTLPTKRIV